MKKIVGYENEKKEILGLKKMLLKAQEYKEKGIRIPRGLVLYGEPGVGKTQLARSIAAKDLNFLELRAATCCEENIYEALQDIFTVAKEEQPSVILLDEIDKIAGTSDNFYMETNSNIQKMLLQELDMLSDDDNVLVVATCNDLDVLGETLLRPGRFDRKIYVEVPDEKTREMILVEYFERIKIEKHIDYAYLSRIIPGYTGAKIECLANEVGIYAIENKISKIKLEHIRHIMNKFAFNSSEKLPIKDKEKLKMIATHEAGHALVALVLAPDSIVGASILPQGKSNGHIHFVNPDEGICSVRDIENEVAVLLAGHVAERVVLGEYLVGAGSDLAGAESRLRFLTVNQGAYGYDSIVGGGSIRYEIINGNETKAISNKIVTEKLNMLDSKAEDIIKKNRKVFDKIVKALMDKQSITREELLDIKSEYCLSHKHGVESTIWKYADKVEMLTNPPKAM